MVYKTLADSVQDLYKVTVADDGILVTEAMIDAVKKARETHDAKAVGKVMSQLFNGVAQQAAGFQVRDFSRDEIGKKIGWLLDADIKTDSAIGATLAQYQRDLAMPAMQDAIKLGAGQGLIKEVVREATGPSTCPWCLERCGIWDPYDANAYGVWARHGASAHGGLGGCDCNIYIRWRMNDDGTQDTQIGGRTVAENQS